MSDFKGGVATEGRGIEGGGQTSFREGASKALTTSKVSKHRGLPAGLGLARDRPTSRPRKSEESPGPAPPPSPPRTHEPRRLTHAEGPRAGS